LASNFRHDESQGGEYTLASLDLRQNEQPRAESELKTAVNSDPKSIEAHVVLASFYWSRNDLKEADAQTESPVFGHALRSR
jgi:Tfp pilus assembly protein PilF